MEDDVNVLLRSARDGIDQLAYLCEANAIRDMDLRLLEDEILEAVLFFRALDEKLCAGAVRPDDWNVGGKA